MSTATELTMRAVVQDRYGHADVLKLDRIARPVAGDGEVLVKVHAAGVDRGTEHLLTGKPYAARLAFGMARPKNPVPGRDLAGVVVEVGAAVTRVTAGDEVYGVGAGSFAEYTVARESQLARKPTNLTFTQAAVVPVSAATALRALVDVGQVQAGQSVLIIGASGGVGTYAVQLAKAFGAEVTGVCSTAKQDLVTSLGADHVIDYTVDDYAKGPRRYDLILDIGGNSSLRRLRRALEPRGTVVFVGGEDAGAITGMGRQMRGQLLSPFTKGRMRILLAQERAVHYERLTELIEAGRVMPSIERTYTLDEVADAMRQLASGKVRGKVAIVLDH